MLLENHHDYSHPVLLFNHYFNVIFYSTESKMLKN